MHHPVVSPRGPRALALTLSLAAVAPLAAQGPAPSAERGAFVVLAGGDTVAVERFTRTAAGVESELVVKKDGSRVKQIFRYGPDGRTLASYTAETFGAGSGQFTPTSRSTLTFSGDSVTVQSGQDAPKRTHVEAGSLPWANLSTVIMEEMTRRVRAVGNPTVELPLVNITADAEFKAAATVSGRDSISIAFTQVVVDFAVDARGNVLGARIPSQGVTIVRTRALDANVGAARRPNAAGSRGAARP